MKVELSARPKLAKRAQLRLDRKTGEHVLLYPEKGLLLNKTSAAIAALCTGERSVSEMITELARQFGVADAARLEREVLDFLSALSERGLLAESA
jgi:pyrroloquinoline quinone biosynthesis protein D